jgi:hypothetical protein
VTGATPADVDIFEPFQGATIDRVLKVPASVAD